VRIATIGTKRIVASFLRCLSGSRAVENSLVAVSEVPWVATLERSFKDEIDYASPPRPCSFAQPLTIPSEFIEFLPVAAYACDSSGRILWFNRRAAQMWGRTPLIGDSSELFCGAYRLLHGGREVPRDETPMAAAVRTGAASDRSEVVIERADGSRICAVQHIGVVKDDDGRVVAAINCFHERGLHQASDAGYASEEGLDFIESDVRWAMNMAAADAE
jgi:hypothetical protein